MLRPLFESNFDKVIWPLLSKNPNAIHLLEQNPDKIDWNYVSSNPNAIHLLEQVWQNPAIFEPIPVAEEEPNWDIPVRTGLRHKKGRTHYPI